jgi:hypothetical protein
MANRYWVAGTGTWNGTSTTNWSASSGGASGASVPTSADNVFFDANSNTGTGAFTVTMATVAAVCADFDASAVDGTMTLAGTVGIDVYGSLLWPATNFTRSYSGTTTFRATTTGKTVNTNGRAFGGTVTFDGIGGGWTLGSALTTPATFNLTNGSLNLGGFTLTGFNFSSNNSNTRTLAFNGGTYVITGNANTSAQTLWSVSTATGLTVTGTPTVNVINNSTNSGFTRNFLHGNTAGGSEANSVNLNIQAGDVGSLVTVAGTFKNVNFTGCSSTLNNSTRYIYGDLIIGSGMTLTAGASGTIFAKTSGTQQITSAALNFDFPVTFGYQFTTTAATGNGTTATLTFSAATGAPAVGSTIIVAGVTPAGYNGTYTVTASTNTTVSYANATTAAQTVAGTIVNGGSTTYTLQDALSVGTSTARTITLNTGTLNLNNFTLTSFGAFGSNNSNTRAIAFGTGNITCTYNLGASNTVWNCPTITGFTYTGTPTVNVTGTSSGAFTRTLAHGSTTGATEANSITFNISAGSDTIAMGGGFLNVNLTGFSGTFGLSARSIYGNLTLPSGLTITAGTSTTTFASTNATTRTITTNGNTLDFPVTFNGVGGSWQLQDALTVGTTRTLSLNNGSFDSGNQSITTGLFNFSNSNTKSLLLGTSTVTITGGTSTSGFIGSNSGTTYDVVNSTIVFSNTGTFAGGSGGAAGNQFGTVTMSAASGTLYLGTTATTTARCTTLNNTVSPCTITSNLSTGFTVDNFNVNGTAGNLVTLNSSVSGTARTISKSSGTVSANYLSIQDSTATGGATWNAYASTNVSNNTGWNFLSLNQGNFLMLF